MLQKATHTTTWKMISSAQIQQLVRIRKISLNRCLKEPDYNIQRHGTHPGQCMEERTRRNLHQSDLFYGQRKLFRELRKYAWNIGRGRTRHLMQIMDWRSRAVLSWELSNIIDSGFCVRALRNTMALTGRMSKIFNTDQGSQFSGRSFARR